MKITITQPWSDWEGVERTVDYQPGEHDVSADIAERAVAAGVTKGDDDATPIATAPRRPNRA